MSKIYFCTVLEYLVPSTGKLYHHRFKLDFMSGDSKVNEVIA